MGRRHVAHTAKQLAEIDYLSKLSKEEKEWIKQFYLEYYQADFNFTKPIHTTEYIKDCQRRNNAEKRQLHSVGQDLIEQSSVKVLKFLQKTKNFSHGSFMNPYDYDKTSGQTPDEYEDVLIDVIDAQEE